MSDSTRPSGSPTPDVPSRLGVGPMSKNAVDATLDVAARLDQKLMLIPSRRQVEAASQGGGYVEGWDTAAFAEYVRGNDVDGRLLLCRDHGGPYQSAGERDRRLTPEQAMASALESYQEDIRNGFDLLHIDTSMDLDGVADDTVAIDRAVELYGQCVEYARGQGREVMFEIGFEDQGRDTNDPFEFQELLATALDRLGKADLPLPTFVVAQTGTKVVETRNTGGVGVAPSAVGVAVRALADVTERHGIALKAHNCDYLSEATVAYLSAKGVHALNVAPEFGVVETRAFIALLRELGLGIQLERFLALAYASGSWRKWMAEDTTATDYERAVIAGHYVYNTEHFRDIKAAVQYEARSRGVDVDARLRTAIEASIENYARPLRATERRVPVAGSAL
ncbi:class II D-tagatose-bisphosphate aldolase, non-catalytic subunit [Nocardiopsis sp. EMB25]|uniref:class II D-tagatose-bisphosphate aldolase non-catalytic subunit n=1 Tax=Nocardiopsis sp. EMB25 TaxID=2835867 RepID=UPI002283D42F|nr:class II D-tagatose-bisphosphate aldolase, non-catalytic subunit [Nocardiopsis sp. EMB25]MCY9783912.1 class II D-tagatose-bisphosphate aldolase, non-catalytic subunit [Nocardiopsis sp. EMB25]